MSLSYDEALASFKVLVCVAMADGILRDEEQQVLAEAWEQARFPEPLTLEAILAEAIDLETELLKITTPAGRDYTFSAALMLASIDRNRAPEETALLHQIQAGLGLEPEVAGRLQGWLQDVRRTLLPAYVQPVADPKERATRIRALIRNYSIWSATLGAFPVPGVSVVTDMVVVAFQVKMIEEIGRLWGSEVSRMDAQSLQEAVIGGVGITGLRMAISNVLKLVPVVGSVVGGSTAFATTWAFGRVADQYFASGGQLDQATLQSAFRLARKEGEAVYQQEREAITQEQQAKAAQLQALHEAMAAGRISAEDYQQQLQALVNSSTD
ncbi:MAG: DUF697 domain-containing protein [Gloeomargaritaceae cyanobacterium C42_A2020_066]|nr:DUF697 domain-containing protein [Gloeomargaritaceae cyanobacterium C42_A2020_066]